MENFSVLCSRSLTLALPQHSVTLPAFISTMSFMISSDHQSKNLHLAVQRSADLPDYSLPLPPNIDSAETTRFSPTRNRDLVAVSAVEAHVNNIDITLSQKQNTPSIAFNDPHLESYVPHTGVNLAGVMQSIVPEPFGGNNKFTHLNMPGGGEIEGFYWEV
jgi:hypothetical protein